MVKSGQDPKSPIVPVAWRSRRPAAHVEVLRLRALAPLLRHDRIERMEFHSFALYLRGRSVHAVDFAPHRCRRGTLVRVQPGQVQRWHVPPGVDGILLLFRPTFLFPERSRVGELFSERFFEDVAWPAALQLEGSDLAAVRSWFLRLERLASEVDESPVGAALLRHLVAATLLDVARRKKLGASPSGMTSDERDRARRFRADVERSFRVTRRVLDYAENLRCSARTLDRLAREAFGVSAKSYLDARVVLEAKRLLAHTTTSIATIADELGFTEATNFVKFFKARTGLLPTAFREDSSLA